MRKTNLIILLVAIMMGGLAAFLARTWIQTHTAAPAAAATGKIVVANAKLTFGAQITKDNVTEIAWPRAQLPEGAFTSMNELLAEGRRYALGTVEKNEPVLKTKITEPGQRASLSALLDEGQRAVTVRVDDVRGIAGLILPGDRVDVVLVRTENRQGQENFADVLIEFIKVLAVDQLVSERDQPTVAKAVTLQVTPQQAQKILLAQNVGRLSLVLRQAGEGTGAQSSRVTDSDIGLPGPKETKPEPAVAAAVPPPPPPPPQKVDPAQVIIFHGTKRESYPVVRSSVRSE